MMTVNDEGAFGRGFQINEKSDIFGWTRGVIIFCDCEDLRSLYGEVVQGSTTIRLPRGKYNINHTVCMSRCKGVLHIIYRVLIHIFTIFLTMNYTLQHSPYVLLGIFVLLRIR